MESFSRLFELAVESYDCRSHMLSLRMVGGGWSEVGTSS